MKPSEDLFSLIRSLNKSEKRYFKLSVSMQKGEKKYLRLFEEVDRMNHYDEQRIKEKFKGQHFIRQLTFTKHYLAKLIMNSLRNFHADRSIDNSLKNLILDIEILYEKRLFGLCNKLLEKGKAIATRYERIPDKLELRVVFKLLSLLNSSNTKVDVL